MYIFAHNVSRIETVINSFIYSTNVNEQARSNNSGHVS